MHAGGPPGPPHLDLFGLLELTPGHAKACLIDKSIEMSRNGSRAVPGGHGIEVARSSRLNPIPAQAKDKSCQAEPTAATEAQAEQRIPNRFTFSRSSATPSLAGWKP